MPQQSILTTANAQRVTNILNAFIDSRTVDSDSLEKSLPYEIMNITGAVAKTGKEIKEKLEIVKQNYLIIAANLAGELKAIKEQVGYSPTCERTHYDSNMAYKCYDPYANEKIKENNSFTTLQQPQPTESETKALNEAMYSYNSKCHNLMDTLYDIKTLGVIINNLEDSKKYNLSVQALIKIGF